MAVPASRPLGLKLIPGPPADVDPVRLPANGVTGEGNLRPPVLKEFLLLRVTAPIQKETGKPQNQTRLRARVSLDILDEVTFGAGRRVVGGPAEGAGLEIHLGASL